MFSDGYERWGRSGRRGKRGVGWKQALTLKGYSWRWSNPPPPVRLMPLDWWRTIESIWTNMRKSRMMEYLPVTQSQRRQLSHYASVGRKPSSDQFIMPRFNDLLSSDRDTGDSSKTKHDILFQNEQITYSPTGTSSEGQTMYIFVRDPISSLEQKNPLLISRSDSILFISQNGWTWNILDTCTRNEQTSFGRPAYQWNLILQFPWSTHDSSGTRISGILPPHHGLFQPIILSSRRNSMGTSTAVSIFQIILQRAIYWARGSQSRGSQNS